MVGNHEDTFSHDAAVTVFPFFRQELLDVLYITAFPTRTTGCVVYYSVYPQELLDMLYITAFPTRTIGCAVTV